jgi:hypothetical protein
MEFAATATSTISNPKITVKTTINSTYGLSLKTTITVLIANRIVSAERTRKAIHTLLCSIQSGGFFTALTNHGRQDVIEALGWMRRQMHLCEN